MKIIYTILFFIDNLVLIGLIYWFFKLMDTGMSGLAFILMLLSIIGCAVLQLYFLLFYLKIPPSRRNK